MFKYDFLKRDVPAGAVIFKDGNKIVSHIYDRNIEFIDDDASKVIQMTINLLYENGGGVIFIRKGVYDITTPLYGKSNIQIFGEGFTTILRVSENKTVLALNYLENAVVCNLKIEAPVSSKTYAVTLYESKKCILDKIYLKAGKGIQLEGQNNIIQNSFLEGSGSEFVGEWAIGVGGVGNKILNNEMWGWGHNCIMGSPNRGVIANNYFHDFYDDCIDPNGNYDVVIIGNTCVKGNLDIVGAFVSLEYNCENFVIANNLIRKMPGGVSIRDSKNIVIVGNRFVQPRISSASFVAVEGDSDGILVIGNYAEAKLLTSILFGTKTTLKSKIQILDNILYGTIHPAYIAYIKNAIGVVVKNNVGTIYGFDNGPYITEEGDSNGNIIEGNLGHSWQYPERGYKLFIEKVGANTIVRNNIGFRTEGSGSAIISAGNTYVDVSHGLSVTPDINKIVIIPKDNLNGRSFWVSDVTSTTFRINISSADTVNHVFSWSYKE